MIMNAVQPEKPFTRDAGESGQVFHAWELCAVSRHAVVDRPRASGTGLSAAPDKNEYRKAAKHQHIRTGLGDDGVAEGRAQ
jgi:hypothetical protein